MTSTATLAQENRQYGGELGQITAERLTDLDLIATLAAAVLSDLGNEENMNALKAELSALTTNEKPISSSVGTWDCQGQEI